MLKKWENGEPEIRALWQQMNAWVYEGFGETLKRLRVSFDANYFESDIYKMGAEIVQEGLRKGILDMDKSGAIIADLEKLGIKKEGKKVLLRPNGTTVYMTQDLALAKLKAEQHNLDRSMYVVADEQNDHFKTLFGILHALGFTWAEPGNLVHASYGMVNLPHGRMKSREGTVVDIDDLLDELKKGAKEKGKDINDIRADIIGKAALQFYLLSAKAETSLKYNPEDSLNFEGKTGPYILYQYVRSGKLLKKSEEKEPDFSVLTDEIEHQLLMKLVEFSDMIRILKRNPGSITVADYVYDLAKTFSLFYEKCPVLNAESEELKIARLCLTGYTHTLLGTCLDLLGIEKLESM
jgi:arginyl-tRNA synthetase